MTAPVEHRSYEYQPKVGIEDYDRAVDVLSRKVPNRLVRDWPNLDATTIETICEWFREMGIAVRPSMPMR